MRYTSWNFYDLLRLRFFGEDYPALPAQLDCSRILPRKSYSWKTKNVLGAVKNITLQESFHWKNYYVSIFHTQCVLKENFVLNAVVYPPKFLKFHMLA